MSNAEFWNRTAAKYAKSQIRDLESYEYTLGRTRSYLKQTDSVLELGCGTGMTAVKLADAAGRYTATDVASAMVEIGRARAAEAGAKNLGFAVSGLPDAALPEGPFDAVLAFNLLHLVPETDAALAQVYDRLKPGGLFISKTVCLADGLTPLFIRAILLVMPVMQALKRWPFVHKFTIAGWEERILSAGFEIIETGNFPARPPSRYIVARKPG